MVEAMPGGIFAGSKRAVDSYLGSSHGATFLLFGLALLGTCGVQGGKAVWQEKVQAMGWPSPDQVRGAVLGAVSHLIGPSVDIREKPRRKLSSAGVPTFHMFPEEAGEMSWACKTADVCHALGRWSLLIPSWCLSRPGRWAPMRAGRSEDLPFKMVEGSLGCRNLI